MDETKEKILAAATRLFARRGLDGVTIREICREAGVNGALVNYHFGTKENLYGACMRRMFESGGGPTVVALDRDVKDARSWKAAVRAWVHGFSDTMHDVRGTTGFAAGAFRHEVVNPSSRACAACCGWRRGRRWRCACGRPQSGPSFPPMRSSIRCGRSRSARRV